VFFSLALYLWRIQFLVLKDSFYTEARRDRLVETPATTRFFAETVPTEDQGNVPGYYKNNDPCLTSATLVTPSLSALLRSVVVVASL
jgi:hypothetical protein